MAQRRGGPAYQAYALLLLLLCASCLFVGHVSKAENPGKAHSAVAAVVKDVGIAPVVAKRLLGDDLGPAIGGSANQHALPTMLGLATSLPVLAVLGWRRLRRLATRGPPFGAAVHS